jgi:hypothetical protein
VVNALGFQALLTYVTPSARRGLLAPPAVKPNSPICHSETHGPAAAVFHESPVSSEKRDVFMKKRDAAEG